MSDVAAAVLDASAKALAASDRWMQRFEAALRSCDAAQLATLFAPECHYRDLLAFSWTIRPSQGADAIAGFLAGAQPTILARDSSLQRTVPRRGSCAGWASK